MKQVSQENSPSLPTWQKELTQVVTDLGELGQLLEIDLSALQEDPVLRQFPLSVPRGFVARMKKGDLHDPLLRQILPIPEEGILQLGYSKDPLQEAQSFNPIPGLLHKYQGRVLLTPTSACAVNCRYCFRRHFPYKANTLGKVGWRKVLNYIEQDPSISEVIFSGGDPLVVKDGQWHEWVQGLAAMGQIRRYRIHTRLPIVLPERITDSLLSALCGSRLPVVMVIHCNHPQEISAAVGFAMAKLRGQGVVVLNQSVLLKKVNDEAKILCDLSEALFAIGVLPYYLHLLDPIQGSAHFAVLDSCAQQLMREVTAQLPGYLVPKLVREVSGCLAKTLIPF